MEKQRIKIGELNFDFSPRNPEDDRPSLEIENDASMVFVRVTKQEARALRDLLSAYIEYEPPMEGRDHHP